MACPTEPLQLCDWKVAKQTKHGAQDTKKLWLGQQETVMRMVQQGEWQWRKARKGREKTTWFKRKSKDRIKQKATSR